MPQASETSRTSHWKGGHYHPHETGRMLALEGTELASFARRSGALAIDMVAGIAVFAIVVLPIAISYKTHSISAHFEFNPFEN